jgi:hypothetical protein
MISNILGVVMIVMAISALIFAALTIYRLAKRRITGWVKYALFISVTIGIASFIALGAIYESPEKLGPSDAQQEEIMMDVDAGSLSDEKPPETTEPDSMSKGRQESDTEPSELPSTAQIPNTPEPEPSNTPPGPGQTAEPDYDAMLEDLKGSIEASAEAAVKGNFDIAIKPTIDFTPYTGFLLIKAQASDNLTASLIRKGIIADIRDSLEAIPLDAKGFSIPVGDETLQIYAVERIGFNISFPKTDSYGQKESVIILKAEYTTEALQKVDWTNKVTVDFEKLADTFWYSEE